VKVATVERCLINAIRDQVLSPEALSYLVEKVNERLHAFGKEQDGIHHGIERELRQVEDELQHIERAILV
jgi:hypothetical protein